MSEAGVTMTALDLAAEIDGPAELLGRTSCQFCDGTSGGLHVFLPHACQTDIGALVLCRRCLRNANSQKPWLEVKGRG